MDISRFCGMHLPQQYARSPSRYEGFVYATDGRIGVRAPVHTVSGADSIEQGDRSPLIPLFERFDADRYDWHPLPPLTPTEGRRCGTCEGTGRVTPCTDCDGEGEFEHGAHTYGCKHCDESGVLPVHDPQESARPCGECAGSGVDSHTGVEVGAGFYALRYLLLIAEEYPDAEIGVPYKDPGEMAMWRAPGVIGALMPIRR